MQITAHQWFEVRSPFLSFFGVAFSFSFCQFTFSSLQLILTSKTGKGCKITLPFPNAYQDCRRKIEGLKKDLGLQDIDINTNGLSDCTCHPFFMHKQQFLIIVERTYIYVVKPLTTWYLLKKLLVTHGKVTCYLSRVTRLLVSCYKNDSLIVEISLYSLQRSFVTCNTWNIILLEYSLC